jgi:predicted DNA-binding ribbon-helix-helix protein
MAPYRNKRSLTIAQHRTSVTLEDAFWQALSEIASADGKSVAGLVGEIDRRRSAAAGGNLSLSASIRLYVLARAKRHAT